VYDPTYCKLMTIVVCDMQFEDTKTQQIMWTKLNEMMLKHKFPKPNFKGFMANSTTTHYGFFYWSKKRILSFFITIVTT